MSAFTRSQPAPIHRPAFTCTDVGGVHAGGGGTAPEAARGPANDWPQFGQNCWSDRTWVPQRSEIWRGQDVLPGARPVATLELPASTARFQPAPADRDQRDARSGERNEIQSRPQGPAQR